MNKVEEIKLEKFFAILIPSRFRGAAKAILIAQANMKAVLKQYLKSMVCNNKLVTLYIVVLATTSTDAKDFGTKGHSYKIAEEPFLEMIDARLKEVDVKKEQEKMTVVVKDRINNPPAVDGIQPARANKIFYFDPAYTLAKDIILPCGKVLAKAGTKVNPLARMNLDRRLLFIDAREQDQIKWLKAKLKDNLLQEQKLKPKQTEPNEQNTTQIEDRIILVGGSVFELKKELEEQYRNKVYFDQQGELTTKFGITASPAVVEQEELKLKIEEVRLF